MYPHWRERRVQRGGKRIMPQLDVSFLFSRALSPKFIPELTNPVLHTVRRIERAEPLRLFPKTRTENFSKNSSIGSTESRATCPTSERSLCCACAHAQGRGTRTSQVGIDHGREEDVRSEMRHEGSQEEAW